MTLFCRVRSFVRSFVCSFVGLNSFIAIRRTSNERTNERTNIERRRSQLVGTGTRQNQRACMGDHSQLIAVATFSGIYGWYGRACVFFWILVVGVLACEFKLKPCRCCDERTGCRWLGWTKWQQMHPSLRYFSSQCAPLSAESRLNLVLGNHAASTATSVNQDSMNNYNFSPIGFYTVSGLN